MKKEKVLSIESSRTYTLSEFIEFLINDNGHIPDFLPKIDKLKDVSYTVEQLISSMTFADTENSKFEEPRDNIFYEMGVIAGRCSRMEKSARRLQKVLSRYVQFLRCDSDNAPISTIQLKNAILKDALINFAGSFYNLKTTCKNSAFNGIFDGYFKHVERYDKK